MIKILTFGVYDMLHIGHILLFKHSKELFTDSSLIVAVQDSETILKYKPNTKIINNTEERLFMVHSIRYVDRVITYKDVDLDHEGFQRAVKWCEENGKKVVVIPRTEGISSSFLREYAKY